MKCHGATAMSGSASNLCRTFSISLLRDLQYGDWIIHPCFKIGLVSRRYSGLRALALIISILRSYEEIANG